MRRLRMDLEVEAEAEAEAEAEVDVDVEVEVEVLKPSRFWASTSFFFFSLFCPFLFFSPVISS